MTEGLLRFDPLWTELPAGWMSSRTPMGCCPPPQHVRILCGVRTTPATNPTPVARALKHI